MNWFKHISWFDVPAHSPPAFLPTAILIGICISSCQDPMDQIAQSHVDANVPNSEDFDRLLKEDLQKYFQPQLGRSVSAEVELLRRGPTQSGVAYPKYYAWVKVQDSSGVAIEGAVRLAAIEKKRFEVTDFMSSSDIQAHPERVEQVFPQLLADNIRIRAGLRQ